MPFKDFPTGMPEPVSDQTNIRTGTPYTDYSNTAPEYSSDNSLNGHDAQPTAGPGTDSQKHLSVFFSGDADNDLAAVLRPLIDGEYISPRQAIHSPRTLPMGGKALCSLRATLPVSALFLPAPLLTSKPPISLLLLSNLPLPAGSGRYRSAVPPPPLFLSRTACPWQSPARAVAASVACLY